MASQITKDFSMKSKLRKLADGGSPQVPQEDGVDPTLLGTGAAAQAGVALQSRAEQLAAQERAAEGYKDGGRVSGPGGRTDDKVGPVMLSDEEYVLPGDTADAIGRDKLDALRLQTHDFKDPQKKSALRGAQGLADGGSPWTVDPEGNTYRARPKPALGLPNPNATAVGPAVRPELDMGTAQRVGQINPEVAGGVGRAGQFLKSALRGGAPVAVGAGAYQTLDDQNTGYGNQMRANLGADGPVSNFAADTASALANVGDAATFGLAGRVGRGLANIGENGGFRGGFTADNPRDTYLASKTAEVMNAPGNQQTPGAPSGPGRTFSDQSSPTPVTADSYQSRRLSEMGVTAEQQNAKPLIGGASALRTQGTSDFQNLGTYGGDANIYGRASDPSNPGRINDFAGVGAGSSAGGRQVNSMPSNDYQVQEGRRLLAEDAARRQGGQGPVVTGTTGPDRYEQLAKQISSKYSDKGQGNLAKRLIDIEQIRGRDEASAATNRSALRGQDLAAETSRANAGLSARTALRGQDIAADNAQLAASSRMQAAQLKYLQNAQKTAREGEEKGFERYTGAINQMFINPDTGKGDPVEQEGFRTFIEASDPQAGQKFSAMSPQDQQVMLQKFKTLYDMNKTRNAVAANGSLPSTAQGQTSKMDLPTDVREATFNDYWNNNLPLSDYAYSNLPGTNPNVVQTESGQVVPLDEYGKTDGEWDNDKLEIIRSRTGKDRNGKSSLRSN